MIQKLDYQSRKKLAKRINNSLVENKNEYSAPVKTTDLQGLGAEIWKDINIDRYIIEERQWD
jgi:hypothetical protein